MWFPCSLLIWTRPALSCLRKSPKQLSPGGRQVPLSPLEWELVVIRWAGYRHIFCRLRGKASRGTIDNTGYVDTIVWLPRPRRGLEDAPRQAYYMSRRSHVRRPCSPQTRPPDQARLLRRLRLLSCAPTPGQFRNQTSLLSVSGCFSVHCICAYRRMPQVVMPPEYVVALHRRYQTMSHLPLCVWSQSLIHPIKFASEISQQVTYR